MPRKKSKDLDDLILNCLESNTALTCHQIAEKLNDYAQKSGMEEWPERTINFRLNELIKEKKVKHQEQGYLIERVWKEGQPKAFILVELEKSDVKGENYQKMLINIVNESFRNAEHEGLRLISVDAVLGAEFSVIVQIYSDDLHYIGRFVKEYLLTSKLVKMTRTIMVWPTDPRE